MRRRRPEKREILPDPLFKDLVVAKFINNLMNDGKKSLAESIFYSSIEKIKASIKTDDGLEVFKKAINNVSPMLEVKSKRIGGATYNNEGSSVKKKEDTHKMAEANKAFAHFR